MAGRTGNLVTKRACRFFSPKPGPIEPTGPVQDEFDESEIWGSPAQLIQPGPIHPLPKNRTSKKQDPISYKKPEPGPNSLPVNIPDWSKILGAEYRGSSYNTNNNNFFEYWDEESEGNEPVIPPHEFLCMNRVGSSFSVHEGVGRTLKGRDLRLVRDAVWEKTGFQD